MWWFHMRDTRNTYSAILLRVLSHIVSRRDKSCRIVVEGLRERGLVNIDQGKAQFDSDVVLNLFLAMICRGWSGPAGAD